MTPRGIPTPNPMISDLSLEGLKDAVEELVDVDKPFDGVVEGRFPVEAGETGDADEVLVLLGSWESRKKSLPTGIVKALPLLQQSVEFGPQHHTMSCPGVAGQGNTLTEYCASEKRQKGGITRTVFAYL